MPTRPSTSAIAAAMPSITSANDVRVIDASYTSRIVSTSVTGTPPFTDDRRCLIASINPWLPARGLRTRSATLVGEDAGDGPVKLATRDGQYAIGGGGRFTPNSRTSSTTPTTSRHDAFGSGRTR